MPVLQSCQALPIEAMNNQANHSSLFPTTGLSVSYRSSNFQTTPQELLNEAIIVTQPDLSVTGINDLALAYFGIPLNAALGKPLFDVFGFELVGCSPLNLQQKLQQDGEWKGDLFFTNDQQEKLLFSSHFTVLKDAQHQSSAVVIVQYNITQQPELAKQQYQQQLQYDTLLDAISEGVVLINVNGNIEKANEQACQILGLSNKELIGFSIVDAEWNAIHEDGSPFLHDEYPALNTLKTGRNHNQVIMGFTNMKGTFKWISINSRVIPPIHPNETPLVITTFFDITEFRETNQRLSQSQQLFSLFMKNSPTLAWIYDEDNRFIYGNPLFMDIVGYNDSAIGQQVCSLSDNKDLVNLIESRNREVLQTGNSLIAEDEVLDKSGQKRFYLSYWFLLPMRGSKKMLGGHAVEVTDKKQAAMEFNKMHERYIHALNASSDAIWDYDVQSNSIYHSENFMMLTGYQKEDVVDSFEWWLEKVHPEDRKKVKVRLDSYFQNGTEQWEYEYRFLVADGSYKYILDKALAVYENEKLVKVIGAMQDITERKQLESRLLNDQVQKQKMINKATIEAQEKERNRISAELHDNVNQLLMSAKLHIGVGQMRPENQDEMLSKASQYVLMAVEEIRNLSKTLNSHILHVVGLKKCITEIANNMKLAAELEVTVDVIDDLENLLNNEQQLMIYRIVQEQSNNILKYAEASEVFISIRTFDQKIELLISDNGKGFNKKEQKAKGIGFINIFNRVDAHNGKVTITSSPGNGCLLEVLFPITLLQ